MEASDDDIAYDREARVSFARQSKLGKGQGPLACWPLVQRISREQSCLLGSPLGVLPRRGLGKPFGHFYDRTLAKFSIEGVVPRFLKQEMHETSEK